MVSVKEQREKWYRLESPEIDPHKHSQAISDKAKLVHCRKYSLFSKWCWENWMYTCKKKKKNNLNSDLLPFTKINFKWMIDLNAVGRKRGSVEYNLTE